MTTRRRLAVVAALAVAAAATAVPFAGPLAAHGQVGAAMNGGASHVGVINVSQVFRKTQEGKGIVNKLQEQNAIGKAVHDGHQATLIDLQQKLGGLKLGSPEYDKAVQDLNKNAAQFRMEEDLKSFDNKHELSKLIKGMNDELQTAVATVAKRKSLDLVMVDNDPELPEGAQVLDPDKLQSILAQKNVYYAAPQAVITEDVATELDNMFAARKK